MRSCLAAITAFGLLVALVCPTAMADQGGVVRIHFSNSLQPDLTEIVDAYHGSGIIRAHVVIESIPGCLVSGYQLGYELVSEDSLVVMVGGFHPSRGWELLGSDEEFPEISGRAAKVPVSVGYWNLWLREGRASLGYIRLRPVEIDGVERILLLDGSHNQIDAIRVYHGGINMAPPEATDLGEEPRLPEYDWEGVPELEPVWVVKLEGDSAYVVLNEFAEQGEIRVGRRFPVELVPVRKSHYYMNEYGHPRGMDALRFLSVLEDGSLRDNVIRWREVVEISGEGKRAGRSITGQVALFSGDGRTEIRGPGGVLISVVPYEIRTAVCHDVSRRIVAVIERPLELEGRELDPGERFWLQVTGKGPKLEKLLVMDYEGRILYEGEWTECKHECRWVSYTGNVIGFGLWKCHREGRYLLQLDEGRVYSLQKIPWAGSCFSPDCKHVLVYRRPNFCLYDIRDPETPELLWVKEMPGVIRDVALSDSLKFVVYGPSAKMKHYPYLCAFSARDGMPLAKLRAIESCELVGPLSVVGNYVFTGAVFRLPWGPSNTTCICVFDLGDLVGMER